MSKPTKHYGGWRIRWTDADGKRQSAVFATKPRRPSRRPVQVEAYEVRMGLRPRAVVDHSFSEVTDYWLEHRAPTKRSKKDDQSMIRRHLLPAFGDLLLGYQVSPAWVGRCSARA
jgi:hypothetical protein